MAISRLKSWISGEVLTASDQNSEFNNILNNAADLVSPFTKAISMGGFALNFDAANTMSLTSSTRGLNLSTTTAINDTYTTVASAATPDIWTAVGGVINYTGTVTATGFAAAPQAGARRTLVCAGAAVFTAGANLIIAGTASGSNLTVTANTRLEVVALTTTQFLMIVASAVPLLLITTAGDILYGTAAGIAARLAIGTAGQMLAVNAGATAPAYQSMATQADQEAGTSILAPVTSGRQQFHPSAVKGWAYYDNATGLNANYNADANTDTQAGDHTIGWATDFSGTAYCPVATVVDQSAEAAATTFICNIHTLAAGTTRVQTRRASDGVRTDPNTGVCVVVLGDQ